MVYSGRSAGRGVHFVALDNVTSHRLRRRAARVGSRGRPDERARTAGDEAHPLVGMHKPLAHNGVTKHGMDGDGARAVADSDAGLALMVLSHVELILASHAHELAAVRPGGHPHVHHGRPGRAARGRLPGRSTPFHHFLQVDLSDAGVHVEVVRFTGPSSMAPAGEDDDGDDPQARALTPGGYFCAAALARRLFTAGVSSPAGSAARA